MEGGAGTPKEGMFKILDVDSSGLIFKLSNWLNSQQITDLGYEETFTEDFDNNGTIGVDNGDASYSLSLIHI